MDKSQVRSCISGSGSITYDPLTGIIGGGGGGGATWGSITGTLSAQTDLQSALDAKQNESIVINSNTTAVLDGVYTLVASATFTDPTPAEGKGFIVFVRNGTATVGGIGYSVAGTIINRIYHSGAWANYTSGFTARSFGIVIDGGGSPITTGIVGDVVIPFNCTITGWTLVADQVGSIVIDVWKDTYANFPPTVLDTIAGSEKPTLSAVNKNQDLTLTTWTTAVTAGDIIRFNVDSASTVTRITLSIIATL